MIDGHNTTRDWQTHPGKVCVWAVGAFEQHSVHLPLATDNFEGDYFARLIAEGLDAPLFPTLPFGTCLEQSGFRGSLTLHPETLMRVVRDVAEEVQRQGFRILVLLNAHGGNHCLVPVVRDINRVDQPLKILLVNFWEFDDSAAVPATPGVLDIHSADWETSLMLALRPELVRQDRADMPPAAGPDPHPLRQADLTMFGVGCFNPQGAVGMPSKATREKGERIVAAIGRRILPHIRDRIDRLLAQPRYSGEGGISIRQMVASDLRDGVRLKTLAGWNQTDADWRLFLEVAAQGCFAALRNGQLIGTSAAVRYSGELGWIGMVLVDPDHRRMGLGTRLMQEALGRLSDCGCVKLDATPAGHEVYRRLGFEDEFGLRRLVCACLPPMQPDRSVVPVRPQDLSALAALDAQAFGAARPGILAYLAKSAPETAWMLRGAGGVQAFCLGRPGANYHQIGPVIADGVGSARAVVTAAINALAGRPAVLDVPDAQGAFRDWLLSLGFAAQRPLTRMCRGRSLAGQPAHYFAVAGPDLG